MWQGSGRANREQSDRTGRVDAQQVVEGGVGINECRAGGITALYWWLSVFLEVMQQWLPGFQILEARTALIYTTSPLHYLLCIHPPRLVTLLPIGPATSLPHPFRV